MHVTLRQLEILHALVETGSVSRAAEALNLTQPAVSLALGKIEETLGIVLFERGRGYFAPTREALALYREAEQALVAVERFRTSARELREGTAGTVSIASNGACAINLLPWVVAEFRRDHPGVHIDFKVRSSRKIASWVAQRQVDIGLIDAPVPIPKLRSRIIRIPCVCIMRREDPLAACRQITPEALAGRAVIAITGEHGIDRELDRLCAERGVSIERPVASSYFAIARNMVRAGVGVALVDRINGMAALDDGVVWREMVPPIHYELALILPPAGTLPAAARDFLEVLETRLALSAGGAAAAA